MTWKKTANGLSKEKFYLVYANIRLRCISKSSKDYLRYGGRGIKFLWKDYPSFKKDMYKTYLKHKKENKTTILERIDNSKHYSKENCRWATIQEQARNRRTNKYITHKGKTLTIAEWSRILLVPRQSIRYRLNKGWREEDIINIPFNKSNKYVY